MFKREKKPKPWEEEPQPIIVPPEDGAESYEVLPLAEGTPSASPVQGNEDPDDSYLPAEVATLSQKKRKKRSTKAIVFLILAILVVGIFLFNFISGMLKGPDPTYAEFQAVARGDINQVLSSSGVVQTGDKRTVFCPATAPIATADLKLGSVVTAGSQIFTFNTTELERDLSTANANENLAGLQAQQARTNGAKAQTNANDYQNSLTTMQQQRDIAKARLAQAQADLTAATNEVSPVLPAKQAELESLRTQQTSLLTSDSAAAAAMQGQIDALATEVAGLEGRLQGATTAVSTAQADVEYHNGIISQLEGLRDQAQQGVLDGNARAQLNAQGVPSAMAQATAEDQLAAARAGVTAPITGVVTMLEAQEGALMNQYAPLCVIESLEKVDVLISLSRYDLERVQVGQKATITTVGNTYTGSVTHIDSMATSQTTQSGTTNYVSATVSIANPDKNITLGIDANVEIDTGKAEGVLVIPTNAVNTDVDGSYVFVVENSKAVRKTVETGLSSDILVEVVSGLGEGETVILSSQNIQEGMMVSDNPAYRSAADTMGMMIG